MSSTEQRDGGQWLSIGHGGWTIQFPTVRTSPTSTTRSRLSHYGETWREHLHELSPDAVGTDCTVIPDEDLVRLSVSGPMGDPEVPAGMVRQMFGPDVPWIDRSAGDRDPRFGNAGSLDYVAMDVYLLIFRRFGGRVFSPHES